MPAAHGFTCVVISSYTSTAAKQAWDTLIAVTEETTAD